MLVAMLTHVFDPPPDHLAIPWGFLGLLYAVALLAGIVGSTVAQRVDRAPAARPDPPGALRNHVILDTCCLAYS